LRSGTVIAFIDEAGERGRITAAIAVARQWQIRGRSVLLADVSADGHIRAFAEVATAAGLPVPLVIRMGAEDLRRSDQFRSLAQDRDLVIIECPPLTGEVQRGALMVTDLAILPCGPRSLDPWTLSNSIDLLNKVRGTGPELQPRIRACAANTRSVCREAARHRGRSTPILSRPCEKPA